LLFIGIIFNIGLIAYYKYSDFFISNLNQFFSLEIPLLHLVLPLAISFFTFNQIAFLVDCYVGETKENNFVNYALFVTFFPHLIAGPIVHHREMIPQFLSKRTLVFNYQNFSHGLFLFAVGLFKKVIIADSIAQWVGAGFSAKYLTMIEAWSTALSYTLQLYFDFSGYSDMALGLALMFNIRFPLNFNSPYKANSIIDFWRRWHITLSTFLRNYIYIPLGGNRKGELRRYTNLMITMLVGGLWHGASWTFVFWGGLHGIALVLNHLWRNMGFKMHWLLGRVFCFLFVVVGWVFFRAESFGQAMVVLKGMINFQNTGLLSMPGERVKMVILMIMVLFVWTWKNSFEWNKLFKPNHKWAVVTGLLLALSIIGLSRITEFLYFQF
jgi:D-alanyl-lipoteichoic acid acyltransferase DltB (MBOAT superfamily)